MNRKRIVSVLLGLFFIPFLGNCATEGSYLLVLIFPSPEARETTKLINVWAAEPSGVVCADFFSGDLVPYNLEVFSEAILRAPFEGPMQIKNVPMGKVAFLAEGQIETGAKTIRGCKEAESQPGSNTEVAIQLIQVCSPVPETLEKCTNGIDEDCDGFTDSQDTDCKPGGEDGGIGEDNSDVMNEDREAETTIEGDSQLDAESQAEAESKTDAGSQTDDSGEIVAPETSTIVGTSPVVADGISACTVTITLKDRNGKPVSGVTPRFGASGVGNILIQNCPPTDSNGVSICPDAFTSSVAQFKVLSIIDPVTKTGGSVQFVPAHRGYTRRACGFDTNHNGVIGEYADCHLCDGLTADPDGDGVDDALFYVSSIVGTDAANCGSTATPCKTIQFTLDNRIQGPGSGKRDILCLAGVFNETVTLVGGGLPTTHVQGGFEYPRDPMMLVGWDTNGDGAYPPADPEELAALDGQNILEWVFDNSANGISYFEVGHLAISNFHRNGGSHAGLLNLNGSFPMLSHIYFHDLEISNINQGLSGGWENAEIQGWSSPVSYFAMVNVSNLDFGRAVVGMQNYPPAGHFLFRNNIMRGFGQANASMGILDAYGMHDLDFSQNIVDGNPEAFSASGFRVFNMSSCSQHWLIRDNDFINIGILLSIIPSHTCGSPAPLDDIVLDRNRVRAGFSNPSNGLVTLGHPSGTAPNTPEYSVGNVQISNNMFFPAKGKSVYSFVLAYIGNDGGPQPGTITIVGNTCIGATDSAFNILTSGHAFEQQNWVFKNNLIAAHVGNTQMWMEFAPSGWIADGNVYDPAASFYWNGSSIPDFASWKTTSGQDASSNVCEPSFVDAGNLDYHLAEGDSCASDQGVDISAWTTVDYDGDSRSNVTPDVGADEKK